MKNIIKLIIPCIILLTSCKKDNKPADTSGKLYDMNFNVKGFTQEFGGLGTNAAGDNVLTPITTNELVRVLYFVLEDNKGNEIRRLAQYDYEANFGTITEKLPAGDYNAFFAVGLNDDVRGVDPREQQYRTQLYSTLESKSPIGLMYLNNDSPVAFRETYFKKVHFTVSSTNANQAVVLDRLVGQIRIHLQEPIPANSSFTVSIKNTPTEWYILTQPEYYGSGISVLVERFKSTTAMTDCILPVILLAEPGKEYTVELSGNAGNNNVIKNIYGVTCGPNKVTVLSGKLFGTTGGSTGTTNVKVDSTWNTTPILKSF